MSDLIDPTAFQAPDLDYDESTLLSVVVFGHLHFPDFQVCTFKVRLAQAVVEHRINTIVTEWNNNYSHIIYTEDLSQSMKSIITTALLSVPGVQELSYPRFIPPFSILNDLSDFAGKILSTQIPVRNSPITGQDLKAIASGAGPNTVVFIASMAQGNTVTLSIFYAAASVIVMGAASAVSEVLKQGLFRKLMKALGEPPTSDDLKRLLDR